MNYNHNVREKNATELFSSSNSKYDVCRWNYTVTNNWYFCLLSRTGSSYKKRTPSKSLQIPFFHSHYIKAWVWVWNVFITCSSSGLWGFLCWQGLSDTFLLLFSATDFQAVLLSEKITVLMELWRKKYFKNIILLNTKENKTLMSQILNFCSLSVLFFPLSSASYSYEIG